MRAAFQPALQVGRKAEKIYEKSQKRVLTIEESRSNIRHVRDREARDTEKRSERAAKKLEKSLKKGVDKRNELRYTNEAVPQNGDSEAP